MYVEMSRQTITPITVFWSSSGSYPVSRQCIGLHSRRCASLLNMSLTRQSSHIRSRARAPGAWNMEWPASRCCMRITTAVGAEHLAAAHATERLVLVEGARATPGFPIEEVARTAGDAGLGARALAQARTARSHLDEREAGAHRPRLKGRCRTDGHARHAQGAGIPVDVDLPRTARRTGDRRRRGAAARGREVIEREANVGALLSGRCERGWRIGGRIRIPRRGRGRVP